MVRVLRRFACLTVALSPLMAAAASSLATDYPGPWQQGPAPDIHRTLLKHAVPGCGEYAWRQRANGSPEYLVYCTRDGRDWTAWLAFTAAERVMGPYRSDPALPPPR